MTSISDTSSTYTTKPFNPTQFYFIHRAGVFTHEVGVHDVTSLLQSSYQTSSTISDADINTAKTQHSETATYELRKPNSNALALGWQFFDSNGAHLADATGGITSLGSRKLTFTSGREIEMQPAHAATYVDRFTTDGAKYIWESEGKQQRALRKDGEEVARLFGGSALVYGGVLAIDPAKVDSNTALLTCLTLLNQAEFLGW